MKRSIKAISLAIVVLSLGTFYLGARVNSLDNRVDSADSLVSKVGVKIDNGNRVLTEEVHATRAATPLDALEMIAEVGVKKHPSMGVYIVSINGLKESMSKKKYWTWYLLREDLEWKLPSVGVDEYELADGDNIKFVYGESPF